MSADRPLVTPMTEAMHRQQEAIASAIRANEVSQAASALARDVGPAAMLAELVKRASDFAEAETKRVRHPDSPPVACRAGCNWCCHQNVGISAPEAFRIARFIVEEMRPEQRRNVRERLAKLDKLTRCKTPAQRAQLEKTCAFLTDGLCTIYPVRPLSCAEFTSYDPNECKRARHLGFPMGSVIHEKARLIAFQAVQQGLFDALAQFHPQVDSALLEMTAAVVDALKHANGESEWLEGSSLFAGAHLALDRR